MNIQLNKPLCVFDLETTGTNISKDRIVEISILKVFPDGTKESKTWLVNPGIVIPMEAIKIHGITNEKVADQPSMKTLAPKIIEMIKDADLAGFNSNRFDVPLLAEELLRNGYDFDLAKHRLIDVQNIFHKMEPRTLSAAYRFYCDKNLDNAHSAEADTNATFEVLDEQIGRYTDLENDINFLSEFSTYGKKADLAGFITYDEEGDEILSFGKYKGKKIVDILEKDSGYYGWLQNADFPLYTKKVLTAIKLRSKFN